MDYTKINKEIHKDLNKIAINLEKQGLYLVGITVGGLLGIKELDIRLTKEEFIKHLDIEE